MALCPPRRRRQCLEVLVTVAALAMLLATTVVGCGTTRPLALRPLTERLNPGERRSLGRLPIPERRPDFPRYLTEIVRLDDGIRVDVDDRRFTVSSKGRVEGADRPPGPLRSATRLGSRWYFLKGVPDSNGVKRRLASSEAHPEEMADGPPTVDDKESCLELRADPEPWWTLDRGARLRSGAQYGYLWTCGVLWRFNATTITPWAGQLAEYGTEGNGVPATSALLPLTGTFDVDRRDVVYLLGGTTSLRVVGADGVIRTHPTAFANPHGLVAMDDRLVLLDGADLVEVGI